MDNWGLRGPWQSIALLLALAAMLGGRGDGVPIPSLIELQDGGKARYMLSATPETRYLFANTGGYGYIAPFSALVGRNRAGKAFMALEPGETVLPPAAVADLMDALDGAGRGTPFFGDVLAFHVFAGIFEQRNAGRASLLRAPAYDAAFVDIEIA